MDISQAVDRAIQLSHITDDSSTLNSAVLPAVSFVSHLEKGREKEVKDSITKNIFRSDKIREEESAFQTAVLLNAPQKQGNHIISPPIY